MAAVMLLGFSKPQDPRATADVPPLDKPVSETTVSIEPLNIQPVTNDAPTIQLIPRLLLTETLTRPKSLAGDIEFGDVLGGVKSGMWSGQSESSPDRVIVDQWIPAAGKFLGVGFPDIRTYQRQKRSPFDAPGLWAPLVAWRTLQGETAGVEPIARVRCMGLTPQAVARRADRYRDMIYTYADKYEISRHLVKAVITEESCFNNKALSPVGAQGLMQLMPDTASWLKVNDPHDPAQNLRAGVRYLASLRKEFDTVELALAAYNAGPGNVRRYKGVPPFAETQAYVVKVQSHYRRYEAAHSMLTQEDGRQANSSGLAP